MLAMGSLEKKPIQEESFMKSMPAQMPSRSATARRRASSTALLGVMTGTFSKARSKRLAPPDPPVETPSASMLFMRQTRKTS